ncbi:c6 transcription factor [Fusarium mundagurra]|uniref:C6 transcription factor n=1 Tax=Fusarium mundagurra TaxID=1567541 RepID=A0A8H6DBY1_9HYPO|nr:c6 transcription factor [Fusarium mundagurra]
MYQQIASTEVPSNAQHVNGVVSDDAEEDRDMGEDQTFYFGKSCSLNFGAQVHSILAQVKPSYKATSLQNQSLAFINRPENILRKRPHDSYTVPTRQEADYLLRIFWDRLYPLYPFMDRAAFEKDYAAIWQSEPSLPSNASTSSATPGYYSQRSLSHSMNENSLQHRCFHILLNAVFALGCLNDDADSAEEQAQRGELYWSRSKALLEVDFEIFNQTNLVLIQALLYMSVYLHLRLDMSGACWNLAGLAIRTAQGLGLHRSCAYAPSKATSGSRYKMQHLQWRTWSGCIIVDRTLALTYGRPAMLTPKQAVLPAPSFIDSPGASDTESNSSICFLFNSVKLHTIIIEIVSQYDDGESVDPAPNMSNAENDANASTTPLLIRRMEKGNFEVLSNFEQSLVSWERELPDNLKLPPVSHLLTLSTHNLPKNLSQQSVALRARSLYGKVLAFRPVLLHQLARSVRRSNGTFVRNSMASTLAAAALERGAYLCTNAAIELIALIDWIYNTKREFISEIWYILFYLYTSGMVLLLQRHSRILYQSNAVDVAWAKCLRILRQYETHSVTAMKSLRLLELGDGFRSYPVSRRGATPMSPGRAKNSREAADMDNVDMTSDQLGLSPQNGRTAGWHQDAGPVDNGTSGVNSMNPLLDCDEADLNAWMDDQIDLAWLSALPFDFSLEDINDFLSPLY